MTTNVITSALYLNRELSWLAFNERGVEEAADPTTPLLERVKFVAIASSNLDEFFMVRVAGLMSEIEEGDVTPDLAGLTSAQQLPMVRERARAFMASLTPKGREGDFFGFFSLCGKSAAVLGPLIFGQVSHATGGNQRLAILTVMILFILGGVLLTRVQAGGPSIERRT